MHCPLYVKFYHQVSEFSSLKFLRTTFLYTDDDTKRGPTGTNRPIAEHTTTLERHNNRVSPMIYKFECMKTRHFILSILCGLILCRQGEFSGSPFATEPNITGTEMEHQLAPHHAIK